MLGFSGKLAGFFAAGGIVLGLTAGSVRLGAADLRLSGNLMGSVVNESGLPQMAAEIQLFDHFGRLAQKTLSAEDGHFAFPDLPADSYAIRVSSIDYLPAKMAEVPVRPGTNSVLEIHLTSLLSSFQLSYSLPTAAMSKDWKWVLRSSPATRPINRLQAEDVSVSQDPERRSRVFSETHAVVSVSGGDINPADSDSLADLGTGFAVSTNILQKNRIQIGGSVAQNSGMLPAAMGLSAVYVRKGDGVFDSFAPEVSFSVSQIGVFAGSGFSPVAALPGGQIPAVRTMSLSIYKVLDLGGATRLEYGVTGETVDYVDHTTRVSPFARSTTPLGRFGKLVASYSDGARPDPLRTHQQQADAGSGQSNPDEQLADSVGPFSRIPQLSYRNRQLELQRTQSYEVGLQKTIRSRTYAVSAFAEDTANGRMDVSGNLSMLNAGDLMSDGSSAVSLYNIGKFRRTGVVAAINQQVNPLLDIALAAGRMGGLTTQSGTPLSDPNGFLMEGSHAVMNLATTFKAPKVLTRVTANYGWTDGDAIVPRHVFTTQDTYMSPGLNLLVRQPLPSLFGMPGHLELNADLRNMLAQGYLPIPSGGGRSLLMLQSPRAIRGGFNFIF